MTYEPTCEAVRQRREITRAIQEACAPGGSYWVADDGSERSLAAAFAVLQGVVAEYLDGGDQMYEACSCGQHQGPPAPTVIEVIA